MNHEKNLTRLIVEANIVLKKANASADDIKRFYYLSRFFIKIDAIKKELNLIEIMKYHIPSDLYEEALRLLNTVGDEE